MFGKKKTINPDVTDTLVGEGSTFEGKIKSEASVRIEGKILGDIECVGDVTIGDSGEAHSNIHARNVILAGIVRGNIRASEKLTLSSSGKLYGNTQARILLIEDGAVFQGTSSMVSKEDEKHANENQPGNFSQSNSKAM